VPLTSGTKQGLGVHLNVAGVSTPREQKRLSTDGVNPASHWVVHVVPDSMVIPSEQLEKFSMWLMLKFGAWHV
jgi:hypothetical protein